MTSEATQKEGILFKALSNRIAATRNILNKAMTMQGENIEAQLDDLWLSTLDKVPEDKERFLKTISLENHGNELSEKETELRDELVAATDGSDENAKRKIKKSLIELTQRETENERALEEISKTDTGHSMEFLRNIQSLIENLKEKHRQQKLLSNPGETMIERSAIVLNKLWKPIRAEDIIECRMQDPFTIVLIIERGRFEKTQGKTTAGKFISGTPYCLIKDGNQTDERGTVRHERIHALSDGILRTKNPVPSLLRHIKLIERSTENSPDLSDKLTKMRVFLAIDSLHGEMVAAAEQAMATKSQSLQPSQKISTEEQLLQAIGYNTSDDELGRLTSAFRTAGRHVLEVLRTLGEKENDYRGSPQMLAAIKKIRADFEQAFLEMARGVEKAAHVIDRLPQDVKADATEELVTLLCFLPPSKFKHAPDYMRAWSRSKNLGR